jgi:hypothetical protein
VRRNRRLIAGCGTVLYEAVTLAANCPQFQGGPCVCPSSFGSLSAAAPTKLIKPAVARRRRRQPQPRMSGDRNPDWTHGRALVSTTRRERTLRSKSAADVRRPQGNSSARIAKASEGTSAHVCCAVVKRHRQHRCTTFELRTTRAVAGRHGCDLRQPRSTLHDAAVHFDHSQQSAAFDGPPTAPPFRNSHMKKSNE